jgi:hypothetical protein
MTYNQDFWRWYLKKEYPEFEHIYENQSYITNAENVFGEGFDLEINLESEICKDSDGNSWKLHEYIAIRNGISATDAEIRLEVEFERWKGERMAEQERMEYFRDIEEYRWFKRKGDDNIVVTEFDVILESIIEKYNIKTEEWERYYEGKLRYTKFGRPVTKDFKLDPSQTHSASEFSKAVWDKDFLQVKNMRDEDVRSFWHHVDYYYKPRIVREFNHSGFIEFEGKTYLLFENVLIKFPERHGERLQLVAEENGAFHVSENKFVKPPTNASHLPMMDLGAPDSESGRYIKKENALMDNDQFLRKLREVEHHFCKMVGGDSDFSNWGKLLIGYVFSPVFMPEVYNHFKHVIFLYLYGEGNVGKGEVAKRLLDFWGISYLSSLNTPKARTVDIALEQLSWLFVWIDEHVPEVPGATVAIPDQMWNSWFELKQRATSMMKGSSWDTERKEVRTMPFFCSNFKPRTDHLTSRCIILHYQKPLRGPEKHVRWLEREKELLQLLTLSYLQNFNTLDKDAFVWDLDRIRSKLKDDVKVELRKKSPDAILQDRQIAQFASLITIYHWLDDVYRNIVADACNRSREIDREQNTTHKNLKSDQIKNELESIMDSDLYHFVKNQIIKTALTAARHDPLTDYIETLGTLVESQHITVKHFNWTKEGHLKIWAKAVWDKYEQAKRGTDGMVRRDHVEEKLKQLSELSSDGELKTVNWTPDGLDSRIAQKGFYIENAVEKELFRSAFNYDKFRPNGAPAYNPDNKNSDMSEMDDDIPF